MGVSTPTAIIAEDEPALGLWLAAQLAIFWPELVIAGIATNGNEATRLIETLTPDIAFLDIRLPDKSGLEVATESIGRCHVVFVTAYEQYAVAAFESEAIDYLLKPVEEERLALTVERLKRRVRQGHPGPDMAALMEKLARPRNEYLEWIQTLIGDEIRFVPVDEVILFMANGKHTVCHAEGRQYLLRTPLKELEARLDPCRFWRVHRNAIIRVASIEKVCKDPLRGTRVHLKGYGTPIAVSQSGARHFQRM